MLDNIPVLDPGLSVVLSLYWELRNSTPSDHPLSMADKLDGIRRAGLGGEESSVLPMLNSCDSEYAAWQNEQFEQRRKKTQQKPKTPPAFNAR